MRGADLLPQACHPEGTPRSGATRVHPRLLPFIRVHPRPLLSLILERRIAADAAMRHRAAGQLAAWKKDRRTACPSVQGPASHYSVMSPACAARATASVRFETPSLVKTELTWNLTVRSEMPSAAAICLFPRPRARCSSTRRSRGVSEAAGAGAAPVGASPRTRPSTVDAATGARSEPPAATTRTAV